MKRIKNGVENMFELIKAKCIKFSFENFSKIYINKKQKYLLYRLQYKLLF